MIEERERFEQAFRLFRMPEPALDRLITRRHRKDRNRRLGTAALALIIAAAAITGAIAVFRASTHGRPAGTNETSTITPENVGDLGLAWTASGGPPVFRDGSLFLSGDRSGDRLKEFSADCRTDGGACEPSWSGPTDRSPQENPLHLDGDTLYAGYEAYDLGCTPDPCVIGDLSFLGEGYAAELFPGLNPFASTDGIAFTIDVHDTIRAGSCERDSDTGAGTCGLLWTADLGPPKPGTWAPYGLDLLAADGKVFTSLEFQPTPLDRKGVFGAMESYRGLYAFDAHCRNDGGACQPLWVAHGSFGDPVVADGVVYAVGVADSLGLLYAFPEDCGTTGGSCEPLWVGRVGDGFTTTPVVADGVVYVGSELIGPERGRVSAFSTRCTPRRGLPNINIERLCDPLWTAVTLGFGAALIPANGEIVVGAGLHGLSVFAADCGVSGAVCRPLWTSADHLTFRAIVASGEVVYVAERNRNESREEIDAYDLNCRTDGGVCEPLWRRTVPAHSDLHGHLGGVYVSSDGTLYVFRLAAGRKGVPELLYPVGAAGVLVVLVLYAIIVRRRQTKASR